MSGVLLTEDLGFQGSVRVLTLNRPSRMNALNIELLQEMLNAFQKVESAPGLGAVIIRGEGRNFCAGGDLNELSTSDKALSESHTELLAEVLKYPKKLKIPIIAAVHGPTMGAGAALALCSDLIVASRDLEFGFPEVSSGIVPNLIISPVLEHLGVKVAFDLLMTGRRLEASEAFNYGIIARVAKDMPSELALALAADLVRHNREVVAKAKRALYSR